MSAHSRVGLDDERCHSVELAAPGAVRVEHGAMEPSFEDKDAAEIDAMMVPVAEDVGARWRHVAVSISSR